MGILEDQLQRQKQIIEQTKINNDIIRRQMADMDKTYDPKRIADDMKRDEDLNHDWYESMKYVDKPIEYIIRDNKLNDERTGMIINNLIKPINDEALIKITNNEQITPITIATKPNIEIGDGIVIDYNTNEPIEFSVGDNIVYNYVRNEVKRNKRRINYNNETYILININDILGVKI